MTLACLGTEPLVPPFAQKSAHKPDADLEDFMLRANPIVLTTPPLLAMVPQRTPKAVVRAHVDAWVDTWSSEACPNDMEALRPLLGAGRLNMMSDFGADIAVSDSFNTYQAVWMPVLQETFRSWQLALASGVEIRTSVSLASAAYFTLFEGETHEGTTMVQRQAVSAVWEMQSGEWRLVQEHTSVDSEGRMT